MTIHTGGAVRFSGYADVVATGEHKASLEPERVRTLAEHFLAANFYSLREEYRSTATDMPTQIVSVDIDGHRKQVLDYFGASNGMPQVVTELENELEETAGSARWVEGADGLVSALAAEGFVFRSEAGQDILRRAAARGQTTTVRQLLAAGVPADPNLRITGHP